MTAEEFLDNRYPEFNHLDSGNIWVNIENLMIDFAKLHVEAQNKAILENTKLLIINNEEYREAEETPNLVSLYECGSDTIIVSPISILNAYPLSLIK